MQSPSPSSPSPGSTPGARYPPKYVPPSPPIRFRSKTPKPPKFVPSDRQIPNLRKGRVSKLQRQVDEIVFDYLDNVLKKGHEEFDESELQTYVETKVRETLDRETKRPYVVLKKGPKK